MPFFRKRALVAGIIVSTFTSAVAVAAVEPASADPTPTLVSFFATGAVQDWTVPAGVSEIALVVAGAQGGSDDFTYTGGAGTLVEGAVAVTPGETLHIVVGSTGGLGARFASGAGGGGGSFVYTTATQGGLLAAAGGGGGAASNANGLSAPLGEAGGAGGDGGGAGGTDGTGGASASSGGGGGLLTDASNRPAGGQAAANGAAGGVGTADGGFGGGGGSLGSPGGGGGGYSGGGGGAGAGSGTPGGGGGGGTFFSGQSPLELSHFGLGSVSISYTAEPPTVTGVSPTPVETGSGSTVTITGTNFIGATGVSFGGTSASTFTVVSNTTITAGVPASLASGTYDAVVTSASGSSPTSSADDVVVSDPTITLSDLSAASAQVGVAYTGQITASGGAAPYSYEVDSGALPEGVHLDGATGALSGTPTDSGAVLFNIKAIDAFGFVSTKDYTLAVRQEAPLVSGLSVTTGSVYGGTAVTITGSGFTGATEVDFGSTPAASFVIDSAASITAVTAPSSAGAVNVTVTGPGGTSVTNAGDQLTFEAPTISVTPARLPEATQGSSFAQTFAASGDQTGQYFYSISAGRLPDGLTLDPFGELSGIPTESGSFAFTVTATATDQYAGSQQVTLDVASSAPTVTQVSPASGRPGDAVTISGTDLAGATATIAGQTAPTDPNVPSTATSLTVDVPASPGGPGAADVVVTNTWGSTTATGAFTYLPPLTPTLTVTPNFAAGDAVLGATLSITASGLASGESVQAILHSTPTPIFSQAAGADGSLTGTATLPALFGAGSHEVVATAGSLETDVWFAVNADGVITGVSTTGPIAPPSGTGPKGPAGPTGATGHAAPIVASSTGQALSTGATDPSVGSLAYTGSDVGTPLSIALALLVLGGLAIARRRLRARR